MRVESSSLSQQRIVSVLTRSTHGRLEDYLPTATRAAQEQPEFLAHLIAWNEKRGQVRDSKLALPLIHLAYTTPAQVGQSEFRENALAHLALRSPRELVAGLAFRKAARLAGSEQIRKLVERYLRAREEKWPWWERTTLQHRHQMRTLYASLRVKPSAMAQLVLFGNAAGKGQPQVKAAPPAGTVFARVATLSSMTARDAAGVVARDKLPFLVVMGAAGAHLKDPDFALALIQSMSPTEVVTNTKLLEKLGVRTVPALRSAFEEALAKVAESKRAPALKTTRAAEAVGGVLGEKLHATQERQLKAAGIDGDWLVLGDMSGSMQAAIEGARQVAAILTRLVKGKVHLIFFNDRPRHMDVTGLDYEQIKALTTRIVANGGTSIGSGLALAREMALEFQGIAVVSDAKENTSPWFAQVYQSMELEVPVYLYRFRPGVTCHSDRDLRDTMAAIGAGLEEFDLTHGQVDYYSLPNLVQTMRTARYSLGQEILDTPLLTVEQALKGRGD